MGGIFGDVPEDVLYVDPATVAQERREFGEKLKLLGKRSTNLRSLYEGYIHRIGANGIIDVLQTLWPQCHDEGHPLGRIIAHETDDVGVALQVCGNGCNSGCMHGVLMETFVAARTTADADPAQHVDVEQVKSIMGDLCTKNAVMTAAYSPGDCAHGVGHALMVLEEDDVPEAIALCDSFGTDALRYYCATGAYMQYTGDRDTQDAETKSVFYPCSANVKYPAACARYKMSYAIPRIVRKRSDLPKVYEICRGLTGSYRLGCFHGLGNAFGVPVWNHEISLMDLCGEEGMTADEKTVCVEGVMERMAKYDKPAAEKICAEVAGPDRAMCDAAVENGMYSMEKDLRLYVR